MLVFDKQIFLDNILDSFDEDIICHPNYEYKFYLKEFNFKLHHLLTYKHNKLGIHLLHQFTPGSSHSKIPFWINKFDQFHFPTLLIFVEDRSNYGSHIKSETQRILVSNKIGVYIDYDNVNNKIRQGGDILLNKVGYHLGLEPQN